MSVDWIHGSQHMWDNHKVAVVEADEAVGDVDAVWFDPDPVSRSGRSVRVILTVILVRVGDGAYYGVNGWESNPADQRRYREGQ